MKKHNQLLNKSMKSRNPIQKLQLCHEKYPSVTLFVTKGSRDRGVKWQSLIL